MSKTKIQELVEFGQSIWLDNISRSMLSKGILKSFIEKGVRGLTSNPTIFEKAINTGSDYDELIAELSRAGKSTFEIYEELAVQDIQDAADLFMEVYEETEGVDGYVSLEINPLLASNVEGTIEEVKRLYKKVNRPNLMLKVPATDAGFVAIEHLIAEGININATLIFSLSQYIKAVESFNKGVRKLIQSKKMGNVHSVASVFVSRIDTLVDKMLDGLLTEKPEEKEKILSLKGKAAVANSKLIYKKYLGFYSDVEPQMLKHMGANTQRVLWGSTSTKNSSYSDIKYVTELIARGTVNTLPEVTLEAFNDHGVIQDGMGPGFEDEAIGIIEGFRSLGIDLEEVCNKLLQEGLSAFEKSFNSLLETIESKVKTINNK